MKMKMMVMVMVMVMVMIVRAYVFRGVEYLGYLRQSES
jgi:hypothetical protein